MENPAHETHDRTPLVSTRELVEPEDQFRAAMQAAPIGMCILTAAGEFIEVNASLCAMLGHSAEELRHCTWQELTHPDDLHVDAALVREVLADKRDSYRTRKRYVRPNGSILWVELSVGVLRNPDRTVRHYVSQLVDVTAEVEATAQLAASEERFRTAMQSSAVAMCLSTADGTFVEANPAACALFWRSVDELRRCRWPELTHPDDLAADLAWLNDVLADRSDTYRVRKRMFRPNGDVVWIDAAVGVVRNPDRSVRLLVAQIVDVTAEVDAIARLTESEERFRTAMQSSAVAMCLSTADGTLVEANPAACALFQRSVGELLHCTWQELTHPDDLDADLAWVNDAPADRSDGYRVRKRMLRSDGDVVWVDSAVGVVRNPDRSVRRFVAQMVDVTAEVEAAAKLAESEERFRTAMHAAVIGMCLANAEGRLVEVNAAACEIFGRSADELLRCTWQELTHAGDLDADIAWVNEALADRSDSYQVRKRMLRSDGSTVWTNSAVGVLRNPDRSVRRFIAQIVDITAEVEATAKLAESERRLRSVLDASRDPILQFGADLRVEFGNARASVLTGLPAADWIGHRIADFARSEDSAERQETQLRTVLRDKGTVVYEFEADSTEGRRWFDAVASPVFDDNGEIQHIIVTFRDVTDRVVAEAQMTALATRDGLTGLPNRMELDDELVRALEAGTRSGHTTGVLMMDLDRFKLVNDSRGHAVGDELLRAAAERLRGLARAGDLVVRQGGDEFVIVMRDLHGAVDLIDAGWRIVEAFRLPMAVGSHELYSTASVGVAVSRLGAEAHDLLREADTAMYLAKSHGGDTLAVFNDALRTAVERRVEIESELRNALGQSALAVWYQPEVDLASGNVVAAEALLRWEHPNGTVWPAADFIEVAEDSGLIVPIGAYVIRQACRDAARWTVGAARDLTLRVNLSVRQLDTKELVATIDTALADAGLDPERLCVEITETALMRPSAIVRDNLDAIHERGIRIASDDFGTGYASLAQLRDYPIDTIKIDRSFVENLTTDERSHRLVAGTVSLADGLGLAVTAEGVETPQQAEELLVLGCPAAQGFMYSEAVPLDAFTQLLRANGC